MIYKKIISPFLDWKSQLQSFLNLKLINYSDIFKVCSLMLLVTFFEATSVATFLPILEFLQTGSMHLAPENPSKLWRIYESIFSFLTIDLNIFSLCISIIILVTLRQTLNYLSMVKINSLKHRIGRDIAIKCFTGIFNSEPLYIQNFQSGAFVNTIDHQSQYEIEAHKK